MFFFCSDPPTVFQQLRTLTRRYLPPPAARLAKRLAVHPRYAIRAAQCRRNFKRYGHLYPQKVLFAAGLPKSGTTWLVRLLASYPGFVDDLVIPDITAAEMHQGGSHGLDLPEDTFRRFDRMLVLMKMHVHGSPHNVRLLREAGLNYVVMFRDLRDVAVSHYFYVKRSPWHPEHHLYGDLALQDALLVYADRTLPEYEDWVRGWHANIDAEHGLEVRYETMLENPVETMTAVARHYELDHSPETIQRIVDAQSFKKRSGGREGGAQDVKSHLRKGVAGDWRNHFTPAITERFKERIGAYLIEFGYESDSNWQGSAP